MECYAAEVAEVRGVNAAAETEIQSIYAAGLL